MKKLYLISLMPMLINAGDSDSAAGSSKALTTSTMSIVGIQQTAENSTILSDSDVLANRIADIFEMRGYPTAKRQEHLAKIHASLAAGKITLKYYKALELDAKMRADLIRQHVDEQTNGRPQPRVPRDLDAKVGAFLTKIVTPQQHPSEDSHS